MQHPADSDHRKFDVLECLGIGGFGEVYLANMMSPGGVRTVVALKILHQGLDPRSQAMQRLRDEARLLGLLNHPSILKIFDLVILEGRITLVSEYVPGADFDTCLHDEDPMPLTAALEAIGRVADALTTAWEQPGPDGAPLQLLHRDIKPSNIRVGRHGEVKLLDFGIAKAAGFQREAKTQTNTILGSFPYMAPERFTTEGDDPAGDVFSLGCVLYEAVAHTRLFDLDMRPIFSLALVKASHRAHVRSALDALVDPPPAALALLERLLDYDPRQRPALDRVADLCDDVIESISGPKLARWARQHSWREPGDVEGVLSGRSITETSISVARSMGFSLPPTSISELKAALAGEPPPVAVDDDALDAGARPVDEPAHIGGEDPLPLAPSPVQPETPAPDAPAPHVDAETVWTERPVPPAAAMTRDAPSARRVPLTVVARGDAADGERPAAIAGARLGGAAVLIIALGLGAALALLAIGGLALFGAWSGAPKTGTMAGAAPSGLDTPAPVLAPDAPTGAVPDAQAAAPAEGPDEGSAAVAPASFAERSPGAQAAAPAQAAKAAAGPAPDATLSANAARGVDRCGDLVALEPSAILGKLPNASRTCLVAATRDATLSQVDRQKLGRILLVDARRTCDDGGSCDAYEREQRYYFDALDRSDADMLFSFATWLDHRAAAEPGRLSEVRTWIGYTIERRDAWRGANYIQRNDKLLEMDARAANALWVAAPDDRARRAQARNTAIEWMNYRVQLGRDPSLGLQLCSSAAGSEQSCRDRMHDPKLIATVTLVSIPGGATVLVNGESKGETPLVLQLNHGTHELEMRDADRTSKRSVRVGADQPTRWTWRVDEDTWQSAL